MCDGYNHDHVHSDADNWLTAPDDEVGTLADGQPLTTDEQPVALEEHDWPRA